MQIEFTPKKIVLSHPLASFLFLLNKRRYMHELIIIKGGRFFLKEKFDLSNWEIALEEIRKSSQISMNTSPNNLIPAGNNLNNTLGKWLYCAVRTLKPKVVVETGVSHGVSSWVILNALYCNGYGKLYSIDLPNLDPKIDYHTPSNALHSGWVVPDELKSHWILQIGNSHDLLPNVLASAGSVDIFFHDSDHSYENMIFEFNTVYPFLTHRGLIISDDIKKNLAFSNFINEKNLDAILFNKGGCAIKGQ